MKVEIRSKPALVNIIPLILSGLSEQLQEVIYMSKKQTTIETSIKNYINRTTLAIAIHFSLPVKPP